MKKYVYIFLLVQFCCVSYLYAQKKKTEIIFLPGAEGGYVTGSLTINYNIGFGGGLEVDFYLPEKSDGFNPFTFNTTLTVSGSYLFFSGKKIMVDSQLVKVDNMSVVPVLAGFKLHKNRKKYFNTEGGVAYTPLYGSKANFCFRFTTGWSIGIVDIAASFMGITAKKENFLGVAGLRLAVRL